MGVAGTSWFFCGIQTCQKFNSTQDHSPSLNLTHTPEMGPKSSSKRGASSKKTAAGGSGLRRSAKEESSNSSFTFQMDEKDFASNFAEKTRESDEKASVSTGKVDVTEIAKTTKNVKSKRNGSKRTVAGSSEGNPYTTSMELDDVEKYSVPATITPSESAPEPMQIDEAEGAVEADLDFENQLSAADFDQVGSSIGFTFDLEKPLNAFLDQIPHSDSACVMESICKPHVLTLRRELRTSRTHQSGSPVVETLDALAELALYPRIAPLIWRHFRPLLIELVGRWRSDKSAGLMTVMNICAGCMKMAASAAPKFSASDLPTATYVPRWDGMIRHYAGLHLCSCPNTNAVIGSTQPQESKISPKHDRDGNLVQNDTTSEDHSLVPITRLELIIHALSNMFPTTPQILHHTLGILAHAPNVFEVLKPDSPHSILHSAVTNVFYHLNLSKLFS
ncbi:hypothetical protein BJ742DRAFT_411039 [Cladochytrium replicatum]|nr:hypothetical protein BJ742DRAFT_411039 [Cladochytrium replicatum]